MIGEAAIAEAAAAGLFPEPVGHSNFVPAQFRGLARQYFRDIDRADEAVRKLVRETLLPFQLRGRRGYRALRADMLHDALRRWRVGSPEFGRLGMTVETSKRALEISEIRVTGAHQRFAHWQDTDASERALVIGGLRVDVFAGAGRTRPVEYQLEVASRASISFHAIGRWFQRSRDITPEALHDAMVDILYALPALAPETEIRIATEGGAWCGLWLEQASGKRLPCIRSFIDCTP